MKPPRRQLAEIIDDAMELVRPVPAGKKSRRSAKETGVGSEQRRQLISYYMAAARGEPDGVPAFALDVSHADMRASLRTYVNLLRAARREPAAVLLSDYRILDARICRASALAKKYPVPSGSPPPNWAAVMAMQNVVAVVVIVCIAWAYWRRLVTKPRRLTYTSKGVVSRLVEFDMYAKSA